MIRYIGIDLDGTLVDSSHRIQSKTKKALIELQKKGIQIILCSGRPVRSMLGIAKELEIEKFGGIIISNNGAVGFDVRNGEYIFQTPIDNSIVHEILASVENREILPMVEFGEYMLVNNCFKGTITLNGEKKNVMEIEARAGEYLIKEMRDLKNQVDFSVNKVLTIVEPAEIEEITREFKEKFGERLHVVQTSPYFMEFCRPEINKAYGLKKLGINPDELMSFGDSNNDLEMLEFSKYPIAMGNAKPEVKEASCYVTKDNNSEGIYEALKHFGLVE